jgi:protein SCO1/2
MPLKFFKKSYSSVIITGFIFLIAVVIGYFLLVPKEQLPVYNPTDVNPRLVDYSVQHIKKDHRIADFMLINQNGDTITNETYKNKIYIADFFFTRCATICPIMTNTMVELQEIYKDDPEVLFLSHSVTPVIDSISVLKQYAIDRGVLDEKWNLTTGSKKHIYELARKSYFAVLDEGDGGEQDFIHTEQFVLVDTKRQIRGFYDGTDKNEIERIIKDIDILKKEKN